MKTTVVLLALVLACALVLWLPIQSAYADNPPPPAGLPWAKGTPWPTAAPLSLGKAFWVSVAASYSVPLPPTQAPAAPSPVPVAAPRASAGGAPAVAAPVPAPAPAAAPVVAQPSGGGTSVQDAFAPSDTWRDLPAGGVVWFRVGYALQTGVRADVYLDTNPTGNMDMAVYAPNQLDNLSGPAAGHGTPLSYDPSRLHWYGGGSSRVYGSWYARITNNSPFPVRYRVTSSQTDVAPKSCNGYWEYIGQDYVFWPCQ